MSLDLMGWDEGTVDWKAQTSVLKSVLGDGGRSRFEGDETTFVPFRNERDQLGRLLSGKPKPKPRLLNLRTSESHCCSPKDKPVNKLKLVRKSPSFVPPVGTYETSAAWIKKSFRSPKVETYFSAFQTPVQSPKSPNSPVTFPKHPIFVRKPAVPKNNRRPIPVKKASRVEEGEVRVPSHKNGFSTLALMGNPTELRTILSFPEQVAQRNESMARFKSLYKTVASLSKQ